MIRARTIASLPECLVLMDERTLQHVAVCPACLEPLGTRAGQVASCVSVWCANHRTRYRGVPVARTRGGRPIGRRDSTGRAERVTEAEVRSAMAAVGRRVRDARLERDVSIEELSAGCGVDKATISRLEGGITRGRQMALGVTLATMIRIARGLGMNAGELL